MTKWAQAALGDLISVKHGFAFAGSEFSTNSEMPTLVTPGNFAIGGGFTHAKPKTFSGSVPAEYVLAPGSVVVTMTDLSKQGDTLGYSAKIPQSGRYLHNQRVGLVETGVPEKLCIDYAYYMLQTPSYRQHVLASATGSTVRHTSPSRIYDYKFGLPPLDEQRRIAEVLGALDDLIDTNERLIGLLQDTCDLSYFGELARGAGKTATVSEVAVFENNKRIPLSAAQRSQMPGDYPYFGANGQIDSVGDFLFDEPRLLVGEDGTVINAAGMAVSRLVWGKYWVNNHAHVLHGAAETSTSVLRVLIRNLNVRDRVTGAVQPKLNMGSLKSATVFLPESKPFAANIESLTEAEMAIADEAVELRRTRDELLPLLMSGKVRVRPEGVSA